MLEWELMANIGKLYKAIHRMEMILKEEQILIYKLDSNCSLEELNLRINFIFNLLKNDLN